MSTNIDLMAFQRGAIKKLLNFMKSGTRDAILKSPTGSGKTIILTHFMDEYLKEHPRTVFVWLTPGKGSLEEQSKEKMDRYIHGAHTKLLKDVMTSGFEEGDCCFINWEKLTKKDNTALKDSERTNFLEWIQKAFDKNLCFKVIIDESHQNFTEKADAIVEYFKTDKIVRSSATPLKDKNAELISIIEEAVIDEGLIKKMIVINEDFPRKIELKDEDDTEYLLRHGLQKQRDLRSLFLKEGSNVNPLIVVQIPNESDALLEKVERFFESQGVSSSEGLSIWLSNRHENLDDIEKNNSPQVAVIIKQAVATGWDCPRAHILVKLRTNMDETFEIQTIGRIRRMPEAKHYGKDALDSCYIYTFDEKFVQGVRDTMGEGALDAKNLRLKDEYKSFSLTKEQRTMVTDLRDPRKALDAIRQHFEKALSLCSGVEEETQAENQGKLKDNGFVFSDKVERHTISGETSTMVALQKDDIENRRNIAFQVALGTHDAGRLLHHYVSEIGGEIGMRYDDMRTILFRLFCEKDAYKDRFLSLSVPRMYIFAINNADLLRRHCREAMSEEIEKDAMLSFKDAYKSERVFNIPQSTLFTYKGGADDSKLEESKKNVYEGYFYATEPRSVSEREFEEFCENSDKVDWFYKNGDKGEQYFSIVYSDNSGAQKLFYPDYILSVKGTIWIIETKGGFTASGESQDIDLSSRLKFNALLGYLQKHKNEGLRGGFVRFDERHRKLVIATEKYNDDINSEAWKVLRKEFEKDFESNTVEYGPEKDSTILIYSSKKQIGIKAKAAEDEEAAPYGTDNSDESHNAKDGTSETPLMKAARVGNLEAAKFLIECGADLNARNGDGKTALSIAKERNHQDIIDLLLAHGAKE